jgi:flagellar hook-basal body complex protein FliE
MSDPIGGIGRVGSSIQGGVDGPKKFSIDIGKGAGESTFGDTLSRMLNEVSATQDRADDYVQRYMRGEPVELHQVMAASEEAGIAVELLVEMRNKLTEAYRSLINMQS